MYSPIRIGITGGIGTGKSTISRLFAILQIPVYNADLRAKYLIKHNLAIAQALKNTFGNTVFDNEVLNGKALAHIVFNNPQALEQLNQIVHPFVFDDFEQWTAHQKQHPYIIKEAALVYETILHQKLDKIIVVAAPIPTRIKRTMLRDHTTENEVLARMANQMDEAEKLKKADWIIDNADNDLLMPQVLKIHQQILLLTR